MKKKSNIHAMVMLMTKGQKNDVGPLYRVQGIFIPNILAINVSEAIAKEPIVNVNCS